MSIAAPAQSVLAAINAHEDARKRSGKAADYDPPGNAEGQQPTPAGDIDAAEVAAEALDTAARLIAFLDDLDGDLDAEDDGTAEPTLAALVTGDAQTRWAGFEGGAA